MPAEDAEAAGPAGGIGFVCRFGLGLFDAGIDARLQGCDCVPAGHRDGGLLRAFAGRRRGQRDLRSGGEKPEALRRHQEPGDRLGDEQGADDLLERDKAAEDGAARGVSELPLSSRRYEEQTQWSEFVKKHFPDLKIPKTKKARRQFHKEVDPTLLTDTAFKELHDQFQTKIDLAVTLLQKAVEHELPFSVVLFDGWFLAPQFIQAIERLEKDWVSILKKNRNIEVNSFVLKDKEGKVIPLPGPHIKIEDLLPLIPAHAYRPIQVEGRTYWCFSRNVAIPALGKVRLVFSFDNAELKGDGVVLVTNRLDWSPEFIIQTYLRRWPIETFYQDSKGYLGLDEYRMRTAEAFQKHWCLVFVAYSFLHLECLELSRTKGAVFSIQSIGETCRQQGRALIQSLILMVHELLSAGETVDAVFRLLFAKQLGGFIA